MRKRIKVKADWIINLEKPKVVNHEFSFLIITPGPEELKKTKSLDIFLPKDEWSEPITSVNGIECKKCCRFDKFAPLFSINLIELEQYLSIENTVKLKLTTKQAICSPMTGERYHYLLNIKPVSSFIDWHVTIKLPKPFGKARKGLLRLVSKIKSKDLKREIYNINYMLLTPGASMSPYSNNLIDGETYYKFDGVLREGCGISYSIANFSSLWIWIIGLLLGFISAIILEVITGFTYSWILSLLSKQ